MLPKINRLTQKKDFDAIKKEGRGFQERLFGILVLETKNDFSRFGYIVSTRISKKAVLRNRAKRLLRESVRKILPRVRSGFDIIFLGKKELVGKSFEEILFGVEKTFKKAALFK